LETDGGKRTRKEGCKGGEKSHLIGCGKGLGVFQKKVWAEKQKTPAKGRGTILRQQAFTTERKSKGESTGEGA